MNTPIFRPGELADIRGLTARMDRSPGRYYSGGFVRRRLQ